MKENACRKHNVLTEKECASRALHRFLMKEIARRKHYEHEYEIMRTRSY